MKRLLGILLVFTIAGASFLSCSRVQEPLAGGGSEAENAIVMGKVVDEQGRSVAGVKVQIFPSLYHPGMEVPMDSLMMVTDEGGNYRIAVKDTGSHNVYVSDTLNGKVAMMSISVSKSDTIVVSPLSLHLAGSVSIPINGIVGLAGGLLYIEGSGIYKTISANSQVTDVVVLELLPIGFPLSVEYIDSLDLLTSVSIYEGLSLESSQLLALHPYSAWSHKMDLTLNTTSTGADVAETVKTFPLAISLNATNFNFSEAGQWGEDVRFATPDILPLSYEIEFWEQDSALVWVLLDSVLGGSTSQTFTMYWGKSGIEDRSRGDLVFSEQNGFAGVWHLKEELADTVQNFLYKNSVADRDHGHDKILSTSREGRMGPGHEFKPPDHIRIEDPSPSLWLTSQVSQSAWIRVNSTDTLRGTFMTMRIGYGMRLDGLGNLHSFVYNQNGFQNKSSTGLNLRDDSWHHVMSTYNGSVLSLYIDGLLRDTAQISGDIVYVDTYPDSSYLVRPHFLIGKPGAAGPELNFEGFIDEVRVSAVPRSDAWIKLTYENQKLNSTLIEFKP